MQAPPLFTSLQRMHQIRNKYCENANNNKMPQWTKKQLQEAIKKVKAKQLLMLHLMRKHHDSVIIALLTEPNRPLIHICLTLIQIPLIHIPFFFGCFADRIT